MADLFSKVSCTYCQEEINGLRVQCCVCTDFDICLQCFSSGAEIGTHRNDHAYKFVDHYAVSIFGGRGSWTGRDELQLLDEMEHYGFGNWEYISREIETRTAEEVKDAYIRRFLEGNIGKVTWAEVANNRPILKEHIVEDTGPLSPLVTSRLPPLDVTPEEARQLGYMSHRDDYEREHDMESEQLVSSLQLNTFEDSEVEIALKLAQVDMYIRRLRERARRKRVVRDYQLVAKFFANQRKGYDERPLTKSEREFRTKMCVFSQFLTSAEHERLIQSVEREQELRHRLSELYKYRRLGLTTQSEAIHYEQHAEFQKQQKAGSRGYEMSIPEIQLKNGKGEESQSFIGEKFTWPQDVVSESFNFNNNSDDNNLNSVAESTPANTPTENLLSPQEIQLCTSLKLDPAQYMILKGLIIQDHLSQGRLKLSESEFSSESGIKEAVTEYLSTSGWLPNLPVVQS